MNKKNILIVGGTGFIGYHLAKKAIQKKLIVTSISTKPAKKIRYLKKVKYIICDISDKKKLTKVIKKKYDYVVNLGGYVDHANKKKHLQQSLKLVGKGLQPITRLFSKGFQTV